MEFYDSQYLLIIIPAVVIAIIFLFFWLFMKETSYDEVLAKQKRDVKPVPAKVDKKKSEKKKNKKKENPNGNLHESDSETAVRDLELMDAVTPDDEPPVHIASPVAEISTGLKERKKKDKKSSRLVHEEPWGRDFEGSKHAAKKNEPLPVTKQPTPPEISSYKRKTGHKKHKNGTDDPAQDVRSAYIKEHTESVQTVIKKQEPVLVSMETKPHESGLAKRKSLPKKQRIEPVSASVENLPMKPTVYIPLDNAEASGHAEKRDTVVDDKSQVISSGMQKTIAKKQRNEYDKENADIKFKDFLSSLKTMTFTEEEAIFVTEILKEKAVVVQDIWQKPGVKCDPVPALQQQLQEKEKLLRAFQDEVTLSNDKCKQLNQELVTEKQKANVVETKLREQRSALEKELGALQNKLQVSYQDHMNETQMQFRQLQDQIEALKQENRILRDAVSKAPTQMESKQSTELNKLRQDYARLMNELTEKTNRFQQEEAQKKNLEVSYQQLKTQLQEEVERRQEDMQKYLRNITTEHEKRLTEVQAAKQDLQSKLLVTENEIGNKNKEVQSLQSKLADTMVSKQQLEQKIVQLVTAEQKRATTDDALKIQVQDLLEQKESTNAQIQNLHAQMASQASTACVMDELQKTIAEKEKQIKLMEESLEDKHLHVTSKEQDIQTLTAEVQKLQVQTSEQASALCMMDQMQKGLQERDEKIKTVEELLETGLIQVANKGEEIEDLSDENRTLKLKIQELEMEKAEQVSSASLVAQLQKAIDEKNEKIDSIEGRLESEFCKATNNEKIIQALQEEKEMLREEVQNAQEVSTTSKLEDLKKIIKIHEQEISSLRAALADNTEVADSKMTRIQDVLQENEALKLQIHQLHYQITKQAASVSMVAELQETVVEKDRKIKKVEDQLAKELIKLENNEQRIQELQEDHEMLKKQLENVQLQKAEQVSTKTNVKEEFQVILETKEQEINNLKTELSDSRESVASYVTTLQDLQHQNTVLKIQIQQLYDKTNEQDSALLKSEVLLNVLSEKDQEIDSLHRETESLKAAVDQQRKKNNELREKNWKAMEALTSTEKMLQDKVNKTAKESNQQVVAVQSRTRDVLKKLFPRVLVASVLDYTEWLQEFECAAQKTLSSLLAEETKVMEHKEKEGEEMHAMLQLECEKYKTVLAETEGILQRLQSSVEEEEGKWKVKLDESQKALMEMQSSVCTLEQELEKVKCENTEAESLKKQSNHLASELEKVESERAICVTEVRELKTQLNETLTKLKTEQDEAQEVVSNLYEAQESLNIIQEEIARTARDGNLVENSEVPEVKEQLDIKKKISVDLEEDIIQLQQLLKTLIHQLSKGRENSQNVIFQLEQKATGMLKEGASV